MGQHGGSKTEVAIDGDRFLINGRPTYEGVEYNGRSIEGMLFNSRMVQAVFDDEFAQTREMWRYPDTGLWDPDRNTDEFCAQLPVYRAHGLLGVTVGMQCGGSIYSYYVQKHSITSAFTPGGDIKKPFLDRLARVLKAADEAGIIVIVNYFYSRQCMLIPSDKILLRLAEEMTDWLLQTGHRNILVDVVNESAPFWNRPAFEPERVHRFLEIVQGTTKDGRRLLAGISTGGGLMPGKRWSEIEDFALPHGNGLDPSQLSAYLLAYQDIEGYRNRPRPIMVNEDSIFIENMDAAIGAGCSWGYYDQGFGSFGKGRLNWKIKGRETRFENLSGFQTVPVNWSINTSIKKRFFSHLKKVTQSPGIPPSPVSPTQTHPGSVPTQT